MRRLMVQSLVTAGLLTSLLAVHHEAKACGGTFCDSGPNAMPVDQTGENILFVMDGQEVEAHIQIQYEGSAENFAWVIPLQAFPTHLGVGSEALFMNLLRSTVPTYGFTTTTDQCDPQRNTNFEPSAPGVGSDASNEDGAGGPSVVLRKSVGAFQVEVLQGGTAEEVSEWLSTNGYQQIDAAPSILQDYVSKNFLFAAIKLQGGADTDEIHPLVIRYPGDTPCVPLKLTAVAAAPDMGVRTFFLHQNRVVPSNYKHIVLNDARIDWLSLGSNYNRVVSRAADAPLAGGHGFITEYAGPSSVVDPSGIYSTSWNAQMFQDIQPELVVQELVVQGLASCSPSACSFNHPLILPLLQTYLPRPAAVTDEAFYACLSCYSEQISLTAWDSVKFASDFDERIVRPAQRAVELLGERPYLTRLFTTISAEEMTVDPEFHVRTDLDSVTLPAMSARRVLCDGRSVFTIPDGRQIVMTSGTWPEFSAEMPYAARIEEFVGDGEPIVLEDNSAAIDRELQAHNDEVNAPFMDSQGCACKLAHQPATRSTALLGALGALAMLLVRRRKRATD